MSKREHRETTIHHYWPGDRMPLGIPLLQLLFAVTLDFLQERLEISGQRFLENISISGTNSNGTYRVDLKLRY